MGAVAWDQMLMNAKVIQVQSGVWRRCVSVLNSLITCFVLGMTGINECIPTFVKRIVQLQYG